MILFELVGTEANAVYQALQVENNGRQYEFLDSIVRASLAVRRPFLSQHVIKALNFQAITCLHTNAGEYRPCPVYITDGLDAEGKPIVTYKAPEHYRVAALMDDFVNMVNRMWENTDAVVLGAFVLWRLNWIHPFINGNGRTARAACYFTICLKAGGVPQGSPTLPELIVQSRDEYVAALRAADATMGADLSSLHALLQRLLESQVASANMPSA